MSLLLTLETSTTACSVALHDGPTLIGCYELFVEKSHSSAITLLTDSLLSHNGLTTKDLSGVCVSAGPGSYTGLRIGASTAKGLCYALDIPLVAVSTLAAMALQASEMVTDPDCVLVPMLDARRMEVYTAFYRPDMQELKAPAPLIIGEDTWQAERAAHRLVLLGNGAAKCRDVFGDTVTYLPHIRPSAAFVGSIGATRLAAGEFEDLAYFEPAYLKEVYTRPPKERL